jgi:CheY-like chemotaxis protein
MRVLVVDDSLPRRRLLAVLLGQAGHQVLEAPNGAAALELLADQAVEAVVSDVKMPRMDGFQLCRALRCNERWTRLPFIFYSSIFIGGRAQELGRDLGATAYLDAKHVLPEQIAKEIDALVNRVVGTDEREPLGQLRDELEFARRYHQVVLSSLVMHGHASVRDTISSNVDALDEILTRLDAERHALADRTELTVSAAELNRLKELSDHLGETINKVLGAILSGADRPAAAGATDTTSDAAASVRTAIRRINEVVRKMSRREGPGMEGARRG